MITFFRLAGLLFCLLDLPQSFADDDDVQQPGANIAAKPVDNLALEMAGLKTQRLQAVTQSIEFTAPGTVVDLAPLLTIRQQYLATLAQQDSANAKYRETDLNLHRTRNLHDQDIVATRRLQEQQAVWQADKASVSAINYQQQAILASSRLHWGELLTQRFTQSSDQPITAFLQGKKQLISVTLPANNPISNAPAMVYIDAQGKREQAVAASLIDKAPQVDPINLGKRVFYQLENQTLPFGSPVTVWLADNAKADHGVLIPETAVVWHLGQAFVFVKNTDTSFSRRSLENFFPTQGGYFVLATLKTGDEIVITGAQTLLSQELKNLIPNEDND
jgi:hypothetical protein